MTLNDIDQLDDEEINLLIAQRVFNAVSYPRELWLLMRQWLIQRREWHWGLDDWMAGRPLQDRYPGEPELLIYPNHHSRMPERYAAEPSSILNLIEKLKEKNIQVVISTMANGSWHVSGFYEDKIYHFRKHWVAVGEALPKTICLLLLRVVFFPEGEP